MKLHQEVFPCQFAALAMRMPLIWLTALIDPVESRGYLKTPMSRNLYAHIVGERMSDDSQLPLVEFCPECLNNFGDMDGSCGISSVSGYDYTFPQTSDGDDVPWTSQAIYTQGQYIDIDMVLFNNNGGHAEFEVCSVDDGSPTQTCFADHPLIFEEDLLYGAPKDPNYPYRAYVAPDSHGLEYDTDAGNPQARLFTYKFKLPDNYPGIGDVAKTVLRWTYYSGSTCLYEGYDSYAWPNGWTPNLALPSCGPIRSSGVDGPEIFKNCANVRINLRNPTASLITHQPTQSPVQEANGCCSLNYRDCNSDAATEAECLSSFASAIWLPDGALGTGCSARWGICNLVENPCCDGLTCVDFGSYSSCEEPSTEQPTQSPTSDPTTTAPTFNPTTTAPTSNPTSSPSFDAMISTISPQDNSIYTDDEKSSITFEFDFLKNGDWALVKNKIQVQIRAVAVDGYASLQWYSKNRIHKNAHDGNGRYTLEVTFHDFGTFEWRVNAKTKDSSLWSGHVSQWQTLERQPK